MYFYHFGTCYLSLSFVIVQYYYVYFLYNTFRWTKKPSPTSPSSYISSVVSRVDEAVKEAKEKGVEGAEEMGREAIERSAQGLIVKAQQVGRGEGQEGSSSCISGTGDSECDRSVIVSIEEKRRSSWKWRRRN